MGFFQRLFSSDYRRAVAAEAQGDYPSAARSFALCGEYSRVAQMHLAQARVEKTFESRVNVLEAGLTFAPPGEPIQRGLLRELGVTFRERAEAVGPKTSEGERLLGDAAEYFERGEWWQLAGDCHLAREQPERAAEVYSRAGLVEEVEEILERQQAAQERSRREHDLFKDYELFLGGGQRDAALDALRACVQTAQHKGDYRRLLLELEERLLTGGRLELSVERRPVVLVGTLPALLGRDVACHVQVRGPSVSRRHARLVRQGQDLALEDAGSHNGTLLGGLRVGGSMTLPRSGTLALGDSCALSFATSAAPGVALRLEVTRGMDSGKLAFVGDGPFALEALCPGAPPVEITFEDGRPLARSASAELLLDGARVVGTVQLIRGDVLEAERRRVEVIG